MARPKSLPFTDDPEANRLLVAEPLALLIGMLLDQQIPMEWAFHSPLRLKQRLGGRLDAHHIASMDPAELERVFAEKPSLHRFPGAMARRVQAMCQHLVEEYDGDPERLWTGVADARELYRRLRAIPGWGDQKAKVFVALLGKRLGIRPEGWQQVAGPYGEEGVYRSIADVTDAEALQRVRETKRRAKRGG